jgi:Glycine rich protein
MLAPARKTVLGLVLAASLLFAVGSAHAAPTCITGATTTTCIFSYTGAAEAWVVPAGVTSAVFDLYGAQGGSLAPNPVEDFPGGSGGKGGHVQATVALTPGATLNVRVGGKGTDGLGSTGPFTVAGGFNGGGTNSATCTGCAATLGGAGGGSSDVRTSADALSDRLLVAGGGGGGGSGFGILPPPDTGNGGDSATAAKSVTGAGGASCSGGGAGTLAGPGAAGSGFDCVSGSPGAAGGLNGGGNNSINRIGAGGGGFFGGGAGANRVGAIASGGGGGSDYPNPLSPPAGISNVTVTDGVQSGNGLITVTYANPSAVTFASASATRTARRILLRWRTANEVDLLGFQVYRSQGHSWRRITHSLIAAKGSVSGVSYRYLDRTAKRGVSYRYRIKAVNRDGTATWFGPVRPTR